MENTSMNFFEKIFNSVTNFKAYTYLAKEKVGKAILYLLFLSLILGAIAVIRPVYEFNKGVGDLITSIKEECPDFKLEDGKLSVDGKMPIKFKSDKDTVIIDTTGNTAEASIDGYENAILVTADSITIKDHSSYRVTKFKDLQGFTMTKNDIVKWSSLLKLLTILVCIFRYIYFVVAKGLSALLISLIALIINSIFKTKLKYGSLFSISIYTLTLPILLKAIIETVGVSIPYFWLIYHGFAVLYLILAMNEIKNEIRNQNSDEKKEELLNI